MEVNIVINEEQLINQISAKCVDDMDDKWKQEISRQVREACEGYIRQEVVKYAVEVINNSTGVREQVRLYASKKINEQISTTYNNQLYQIMREVIEENKEKILNKCVERLVRAYQKKTMHEIFEAKMQQAFDGLGCV